MAAGMGALVLFGSAQVTMIGWGLVRGERPVLGEWFGAVIALAGLTTLTLPGTSRPDLVSFLLVSFTAAANMRSRRVMQRLHMTHDEAEDFDHPHLPQGHQ